MGTNSSKATQQSKDQQLLTGLQNNQGTLAASWTLIGQAYTLQQIMVILQGRVAKQAAVEPAKQKYSAAVLAAREEVSATKPVVDAVVKQLRVWCANAPDALGGYGLTVAKQSVRSPVTKVLAAAKGKNTRAARGTKGKLEKSQITGTVPPAITIDTETEKVSTGATAPAGPSAAVSSPTATAGGPHTPTAA